MRLSLDSLAVESFSTEDDPQQPSAGTDLGGIKLELTTLTGLKETTGAAYGHTCMYGHTCAWDDWTHCP